MDFMDLLINIAIAIILLHIITFIYSIYDGVYRPATTNSDSGFSTYEIKNIGKGILDQVSAKSIPVFILILALFIVMYIIYLVIIYVIPPTGFPTLFIPIRELLLKIYPLPALIEKGVFRLFDRILELFGLKASLITFLIKFTGALTDFTKDNIKDVLIMLAPSLEPQINDYAKKVEESFNENNKNNQGLIDLENSEVHRKIQEDKEICIAQNTKIITPNMSATEKININIKNNFEKVNCESKAITKYVRINY